MSETYILSSVVVFGSELTIFSIYLSRINFTIGKFFSMYRYFSGTSVFFDGFCSLCTDAGSFFASSSIASSFGCSTFICLTLISIGCSLPFSLECFLSSDDLFRSFDTHRSDFEWHSDSIVRTVNGFDNNASHFSRHSFGL